RREGTVASKAGSKSADKEIRAAGGLVWRDLPRGRLLAVIHRPRYDDWSLPKGKLHKHESWLEAALREVEEEIGYRTRAERFAGAIAYPVDGRPKTVMFWHMTILAESREQRDDEADEVAWLTVDEARARLV